MELKLRGGFMEVRKILRCGRCGMFFIAVLTEEDLRDGCRSGVTLCPNCLDKVVAGLTKSKVEKLIEDSNGC